MRRWEMIASNSSPAGASRPPITDRLFPPPGRHSAIHRTRALLAQHDLRGNRTFGGLVLTGYVWRFAFAPRPAETHLSRVFVSRSHRRCSIDRRRRATMDYLPR